MKTRFLCLCVATVLVGCTSSPSPRTSGGAGSSGAGTAGTGTAGSGSGTAGTTGTAGSGAGTAGTTGTAGSGAGTAGTTGTAGSTAGTTGTAGASGSAGTAGATGAGGTTDGGTTMDATTGGTDGPTQVPTDYTGHPLGGMPQSIPGMIQIENYDTGGEGVAYHDQGVQAHGQLCGVTRTDVIDLNCTGQQGSPTDKNQDMACANLTGDAYLGYIATGDWLKYTVTVKEAGTYVVSTHAGVAGNTKIQLTFTPTVKTEAFTLPNTSGCGVEAYHVWATQKNLATIALQPGTYVMRLDFVAATLNIDWVAFTKM